MDPFVLWVTAAIAGLAGFCGWLIKWALAHLESDLAYSRKTAYRGTELAEKAVSEDRA